MQFKKHGENPVLTPQAASTFVCPVAGEVRWEEKDVFNPAAAVKDGQVVLLYRAEDRVGRVAGTSRIGLATSEDGVRFERMPQPVLFPDRDAFFEDEKEGGLEDPRIALREDGTYILTYTAFNGVLPRLFVASSKDCIHWEKHGYAFQKAAEQGLFDHDFRCKSGAVLCEVQGENLVAKKVNGVYWMYWGEGVVYAATSDNLIDWVPILNTKECNNPPKRNRPGHMKWNGDRRLYTVLDGRKGCYDSWLVEPGPPPIYTEEGIQIIYNGAVNKLLGKEKGLRYCVGSATLNPRNPLEVLDRPKEPFLVPEEPFERTGQVGRVCFAEGLVYFKNQWFLYYGTADSQIAVATAERLTSL